jgi:arylsulfatase A-like enzyme
MPRKLLLTLWMRLICFASLTAIFAVTISILAGIDGWVMYETGRRIAIETGAKIVLSMGFGLFIGTAATLVALPYVVWQPAMVGQRSERVARIAVRLMLLTGSSVILGVLLRWAIAVRLLHLSNEAYIVLWCCLSILLFVGTLVWYTVTPRRFVATATLVDVLAGRVTRRFLLVAGVAGLITAFSNKLVSQTSRQPERAAKAKPSSPNIVLVTFDALCAEDMSLYGYPLPTTPNIDSLAQTSFAFSNYYAASTFTTPCIVSMLTGRYPSNTHVYHYGGRLYGEAAAQTLPNSLRNGGYVTAASVANPGAHPDCLGFGVDFDELPPPPIKDFASKEAAARFHSATLAADVGFAGRIVPYLMEQVSPRLFGETHSDFPPSMSFQQAGKLLDGLQGPYFLWVHVYAPHFPYLPEPPFLKQFLHTDELRTHTEFAKLFDLTGYNYSAAKQPDIDRARLRYNEWIAQADDAFGQFMTKLRASAHFDNTAVIVSSDHGESFQGGYAGHGGPSQLRPIVHVPLVVHLPGQTEGHKITTIADQTTLAPTILEIADIARPDWMDGHSLGGIMRGETGAQTPVAFTQYFEPNSAFKPITRGTVGAVDGQHQYVFDVEKKTGVLYNLDEAQDQKIELSMIDPKSATDLHDDIKRRFPDLLGG